MKILKFLTLFAFLITSTNAAFASRGGVDKNGCHVNKKTGLHHCHKKDKTEKKKSKKAKTKKLKKKK